MERKRSTAVVTAEQVTTALRQASVTVEEEKVLRMRYGAGVETKVALPAAYGGNQELEAELLLSELQLLRAVKLRKAQATKAAAPRNAIKDKIVSNLKAKRK